MSDIITWYFIEKWWVFTVDWELVKSENTNWAEDWDKVEARKIEESDIWYSYEILKIIKWTNKQVLNVIKWIYKKIEWTNYGFINKVWWSKKEWIKIFDKNLNGARDWDIVIWKIIKIKWGNQAIIKTIIDENIKQYVWIYHNWKILLDNKKKIRLASNDYNLENWDVAVIVLDDKNLWTVKWYLWKEWDKWVDFLKVAYESGAKVEFSKEVLEEVKDLKNLCTPEEIEKREDLREMFTITIDWPDSKDLDDAISLLQMKNGNFKLYVHIADVSHYIKEGSAIDSEAIERWTSTYFVDHVIPMLPEKLSNNLCSLNPNTDKLTKTCEVEFDENWIMVTDSIKVFNSVINSNFRTTYKEIQELHEELHNKNWIKVWDELMFGGVVDSSLKKIVKNSFKLSALLSKQRLNNWELNFDTPQPKIHIDDFWNPIWFKEYTMYDSMEVIKSFMVAANVAVNNKYWNGPFLHRIHEKPSQDKIENLVNIMSYFGINMKWFKWFSNQIANLLNTLKWHPKEKFLHRVILTSMKRAVVSENREWHFWLWVDGEKTGYTWFTSPIRRYADTQIHRIIWETLNSENEQLSNESEEHFNSIMSEIALKVTIKEQKAENIATKVNYNAAIKYMKDKIWEEFNWMITWITNWWKVYIELDNTIVWEALIDMNSINLEEIATDFYKMDNWKWGIYTPWDNVLLKLKNVSVEEENIYFEIIEIKEN